ncbi:MAG: cell division protein FtsL [Thiomicrorhabdus sp.]|nr:MAG: cell division protein FtsL [Thiomicrorhabdus sp.]
MLNIFPKPTLLIDFKWRGLFLFILVSLVLVSLVAITRVQHQVRHLETQYYHSLKQSLHENEEWGRLRLELEHLTAPAKVEQIAKAKLNMTSDKSNFQIIYIVESTDEQGG